MFEPLPTISFIIILIIGAYLVYRLQKGKNPVKKDSSSISPEEFEILE